MLKDFGITIINTKTQDATKYQEEYFGKFDKILLDVPCLGLGVLKRKPDIKWQRKKEDIENISKIQYNILETCSKYLKPGGKLVYSTCSILSVENKDMISKFLKENKNFEIENLKIEQNNNNIFKENYFNKYIIEDKFLQVYQNKETDGFFICKLRKKGKK